MNEHTQRGFLSQHLPLLNFQQVCKAFILHIIFIHVSQWEYRSEFNFSELSPELRKWEVMQIWSYHDIREAKKGPCSVFTWAGPHVGQTKQSWLLDSGSYTVVLILDHTHQVASEQEGGRHQKMHSRPVFHVHKQHIDIIQVRNYTCNLNRIKTQAYHPVASLLKSVLLQHHSSSWALIQMISRYSLLLRHVIVSVLDQLILPWSPVSCLWHQSEPSASDIATNKLNH